MGDELTLKVEELWIERYSMEFMTCIYIVAHQ